jgi:iron complex transport system ATP-binding protein
MTVLDVRDLTVRRGGRAVLNQVSVRFEPGALVAVVGANGAGKSTLLSVLAGLVQPNGGDVTLDGRPLQALDKKALARRRAYLPQSPRAEWPIPVGRLVALGLTPELPVFGDLPSELKPRLDQAIADADLETHRDQPATTLSGGELARAMLARALVGRPEILIADEPLAGLDPRHALDSLSRLRAVARAGGVVVAAVHDLTLAARFADRILALHEGSLAVDGTPRQVLTPATLRHVFGVVARLKGEGEGAYVEVTAPA